MPNVDRRSVLVGSAALTTGGALASLELVGARDDGKETDTGLELSVSATDSVPVLEGRADFLVKVTNNGDKPASVPVSLEIAHIDQELETLELDAGERGETYATISARSLGSGEHDWTITAGDEIKTGALTVESVGSNNENRDDLKLTVHTNKTATARIEDGDDTTRVSFNMTLFNHGDEPVSTEGTFEITCQTRPVLVDLGARGSQHVSYTVELSPGEYEWTVTVDGKTKTGTLTVVR